MKEGRPRLYLVSPPMPDPELFPVQFAEAAAAADVASLLMRSADTDDVLLDLVTAVMATGYEHNVAILVDGNAELAARSGADGVHLAGGTDVYSNARSLLGSDRIVGMQFDGSRHTAMELGEAGVDYMAFDQSEPLAIGAGDDAEAVSPLEWWSELFQVPCVAFAPVAAQDVAEAVRAGADFIRPDDDMWASIDRATDTVRRYNALIDEAV
jgi:thiamine-phosphate pyrophosphorylase